jgi:hypothetical protein
MTHSLQVIESFVNCVVATKSSAGHLEQAEQKCQVSLLTNFLYSVSEATGGAGDAFNTFAMWIRPLGKLAVHVRARVWHHWGYRGFRTFLNPAACSTCWIMAFLRIAYSRLSRGHLPSNPT